MDDDTFIENLDLCKWNQNNMNQARRLEKEGRLVFVSGSGWGRYVKPENVELWHDVISRPNEKLSIRPPTNPEQEQ